MSKDWSILIGDCSYEPYEYEIKHLHNTGKIKEAIITEKHLKQEYNENENEKDYFYIYYYGNNIKHNTFDILDYKLKINDFEIYEFDNEIYIRKKYKDIEILKTVLNDLCYFYNYFKDSIDDEIKNRLDINKYDRFLWFECNINRHNHDLYFILNK
jgi:hypothetical protein